MHAHAHVSRRPATDFGEWGDRLHCFGLDFRDLAELERFCAHVKRTFTRLDIIINNACQTIRRPAQYYEHLLVKERADPSERAPAVKALLENNTAFCTASAGHAALLGDEGTHAGGSTVASGSKGLPGVRVEILEEDDGEVVYDESKMPGVEGAAHSGGVGAAAASAVLATPSARAPAPAAHEDLCGDKAARVSGAKGLLGEDKGGDKGCESGGGRGNGKGIAEGQVLSGGVRRGGGAAEMSQLVVLEEDLKRDKAAFPAHERCVSCPPPRPVFWTFSHSTVLRGCTVWCASTTGSADDDTELLKAIIYPTESSDSENHSSCLKHPRSAVCRRCPPLRACA
jgi:hypothetical protein